VLALLWPLSHWIISASAYKTLAAKGGITVLFASGCVAKIGIFFWDLLGIKKAGQI
jgi:hypothetical protein